MKFFFIALLLGTSQMCSAQISQDKQQKVIELTKGVPVTIDGKIDAGEWKDALVFEMSDRGKVYLKHDGAYMYVGLRGTKAGLAQVYVKEGDNSDVTILHASAALSRAVYKQDANRLWQLADATAADLRDRTITSETAKKMADYLAKYNWVANNIFMGNESEIEFKFKPRSPAGIQIAVGYWFWDESGTRSYPAALADDCVKERVLQGWKPPDLKFDFSQWAKLNLK